MGVEFLEDLILAGSGDPALPIEERQLNLKIIKEEKYVRICSNNLLPSLGSLGLLLIGWVTQKYLVPYLSTEKKKKMAELILLIADDVTNYFLLKYPKANWAEWIDQSVEQIIQITGVDREVALRAAKAAIVRKQISNSK